MASNRPTFASDSQEIAAELLITPSALVELSKADAAQVVQYMQPKRIKEGVVFIQEGEKALTLSLIHI